MADQVFDRDLNMSAVHFEIEHSSKGPVVRDKGSCNGTWLNSKKIGQSRLKNGDKIRAGLTTFEVKVLVIDSDLESTREKESIIEPRANPALSYDFESSLLPCEIANDRVRPKAPEFCISKKRFSVAADVGIPIVIDSVCRAWSISVVFHPLKISQRIPEGDTIALWGIHGSHFGRLGPVAMPWAEFKRTQMEFLPRLVAADAVVFFGGQDAEVLAKRLEVITSIELSGFSESNGLLPIAWPSTLATILDVKGNSACQQMFGSFIASAVFASPRDDQTIIVACTDVFAESLVEFGFKSVGRIFD